MSGAAGADAKASKSEAAFDDVDEAPRTSSLDLGISSSSPSSAGGGGEEQALPRSSSAMI
jgi:hypothetical protein